MSLGPHTVARLRAPLVTDAYGNRLPDWAGADTLEVPGCSVQPGGGGRLDDTQRTAHNVLLSVWMPTGDVLETDRVTVNGVTYDIAGIERWEFPPLDHLVVRLMEAAG